MIIHILIVGALALAPSAMAAEKHAVGSAFRDCETICPEMVVIPAGNAVLGSTDEETTREDITSGHFVKRDKPQYTVTIARPLAIGKYEVTLGQYRAFAKETNRPDFGSCWIYNSAEGAKFSYESAVGVSWHDLKSPIFKQTETDPVACVSWADAKAYTAWLTAKTGKTYRLMSESEWEYAARAGAKTARFWGNGREEACQYANVGDMTAAKAFGWPNDPDYHFMCSDGYVYTAPAGSFKPNAFGLHDMAGNVYEWVQDCFNETNDGALTDGSARETGDCRQRMLRGGGLGYYPRYMRLAFRIGFEEASFLIGFRIAREL